MDFLKLLCACAALSILTGCPEHSSSDNTEDNTEDTSFVPGIRANIQANIHNNENSATIAASMSENGTEVDLIAGDVFEASTENQSSLLDAVNVNTGDYVGTLSIDDPNQPITISIQHKPLETREDRWYPVEAIDIDPGEGEFVGRSTDLTFPPAVTLTHPEEYSTYIERNAAISITWDAENDGDNMRLLAAITCNKNDSELSYGISYDLGEDDGSHSANINQFIYSESIRFPLLEFMADLTSTILGAMLEIISFGIIDADDLDNPPFDAGSADCEILLTVIREKDSPVSEDFDSGTIIGSTSTSVTILYRPNDF